MLSSHLAFTFHAPLDLVWAWLRLIPLAILAPSNRWVGWLTESDLVCWLWMVSWGSSRLGVTYVRTVIRHFWLVDVYKLCRVRNSFELLCPWYRIGYGVDLTQRFLSIVIWVLSSAMSYLFRGPLFLELLSLLYPLLLLVCIYSIIAYLSIALLWPGEVELAEYVCTHVFVIVLF
jgi:hypothetical protein